MNSKQTNANYKENAFPMNKQNIAIKTDTVLLKSSALNMPTQPMQVSQTNADDSTQKTCIFESYSSSLITQNQLVDETTQTKRARFLAESFSSTFSANEHDKKNTQATAENRKYRKLETYNSFENPSSNDKPNEYDFMFDNITINSSNEEVASQLKISKADSPFYGLPLKVQDLLKKLRNISCFYDWQHDLLSLMVDKLERLNDFLSNNMSVEPSDVESLFLINLLYLSPTSGGKTLVAEMLMLYCLLRLKKNCIFIMPFVSIVQEKVQLMIPFGENLNFNVDEYAGVKGNLS